MVCSYTYFPPRPRLPRTLWTQSALQQLYPQYHFQTLLACQSARSRRLPLGLFFQLFSEGKDIGDVEFDAVGESVDSRGVV